MQPIMEEMKYTREDLINYSVNKLIDIIFKQQQEIENATENRRKLERIERIINDGGTSDSLTVESASTGLKTANTGGKRKPGRPAMTPEERAESYERYKAKKREEYARKKQEKVVTGTENEQKVV